MGEVPVPPSKGPPALSCHVGWLAPRSSTLHRSHGLFEGLRTQVRKYNDASLQQLAAGDFVHPTLRKGLSGLQAIAYLCYGHPASGINVCGGAR